MFTRSHRSIAVPLALAACSALEVAVGAVAGSGRSPVMRLAAQQVSPCTPELAALVSRVQDRHTRVPLAGADLTVSWRTDRENVARVSTDSTGRAVVCAPPDLPVSLRVAYHQVRGSGTATLNLARPTLRVIELDAPGAYVRGLVLDEATGAPVPQAQVTIARTALTAVTNAEGRFRFERVPVGDFRLRISHVAYTTVPSELRVRREDLDVAVRLAPAVIPLDAVVVNAFSRRLDTVGFYERERRGMGTFIGRRQIDGMNAQTAADLLRNIPGLRLVPHQGRRNAARNDVFGRARCTYSYVVDGARTLPDFDLDLIAPYAIEGIEVYRGMAEVPAAFRSHAARDAATICGVIAIWTRDSH